MRTSRAMVVTGPGSMELREFPLPEIGENDGLLKVELVGVCGSDPGIFKGKAARAPRPYPLILGHEIVGRIHKAGPQALSLWGVREGERVIVEYAFGCGECPACLAGRYTVCRRMRCYGSMIGCADPPHLFGAYSDYLYLPPRAMVHRIGEEISPEVGVLIGAVLGNGVRWLSHIGGCRMGQAVAIVGPGQQGMAATIVARESGAEPIMVVGLGRDGKRLDLCREFGAHLVVCSDQEDPVSALRAATGGDMAELVMDVSGHPSGAALALDLAGVGATIVLPGLYGGATQVPLLLDKAIFKEQKLLGVFSQDFASVEAAIKLARRGRYPLAKMISHRFPLERAEEAVRLVGGELKGEPPLKVVIDPASI
ncbi:MAG: alcohol dehydrogenase catalytic domain-containing protein [Deltaproteobacteria bacterium]|nr:alcohol dehydrogenase catalytic domain-containing protein [Deltaproteobacteria bacterium]